jgi:hypothetical protein
MLRLPHPPVKGLAPLIEFDSRAAEEYARE